MPALRALLSRRKGSPTMSSGGGPPPAGAPPPPGAPPPSAPQATSPRTAAQLARAAFFATPPPSKPAPPRPPPEVSTSPSPTSASPWGPGPPLLRRQLSACSLALGAGLGPLGAGLGRVKSADGLADVAPLLSRQRSCDSAMGRGSPDDRPHHPQPPRTRATSCYNVLQFLRERALPRSSSVVESQGPPMRKCLTAGRLQGLAEPLQPVNRLRVPPPGHGHGAHGGHHGLGAASRVCSRCSSILSLASSSRYSLHASAASFTPLSPSRTSSPAPGSSPRSSPGAAPQPEEYVLCKLCLMDVPETLTTRLDACQCRYCLEVRLSANLHAK